MRRRRLTQQDRSALAATLASMAITGLFSVALAIADAGLLAVAAMIMFGAMSLGVLLWWVYDGSKWGALGLGVIQGVVLATLVGALLTELSRRGEQLERERAFRLTLSLQNDLSGIDLRGRELQGIYLARKELSEATFAGSDLTGANLLRTKAGKADFSGARLAGAAMRLVDLREAKLTRASLVNADALLADMRGARLHAADLRGADLGGADLREACLTEANLQGADLTGADLRGAVLTRARLEGTVFESDLRPARLEGAGLAGARHDGRTRWPRTFDLRIVRPRARAGPGQAAVTALSRTEMRGARPDRVVAVIDADTIELAGAGPTRLIGINAPDEKDPQSGAANRFVRRQIPPGSPVRYAVDATLEDKFSRALLHVILPDGRLLSEVIVDAGFAASFETGDNKRFRARLAAAADRARSQGRHIWSRCG